MSIEGYVVREMTRHEFDLTISMANSEGWNPGIHDAEPFYVTDPKGFFVGIFEANPWQVSPRYPGLSLSCLISP